MCVTLLGRPYEKIYKRRSVFVTVSEKPQVKEDWGHIDPMVPEQG